MDSMVEGALVGAATEVMSGVAFGGLVVLGGAVGGAVAYTYGWIRGEDE